MQIYNSTISGNTAALYGGGISAITRDADVTVWHSTITKNVAPEGSGIWLFTRARLNIGSTIVSGNEVTDIEESSLGSFPGGRVTSYGHNLIGTGDTVLDKFAETDLIGVTDAVACDLCA